MGKVLRGKGCRVPAANAAPDAAADTAAGWVGVRVWLGGGQLAGRRRRNVLLRLGGMEGGP